MSLSVLSDLRDLKRAFADLFAPSPEDENASYQLAVSARRFSKNTKAVVDDKLTFSATLMRAGEVEAANRLLEEFERDVRDEEAALIECVNEVKVAGAVRKQSELRRRVASVAALGLIGSSVLGFSAASMAAVGMFKDRANSGHPTHLASGSLSATHALAHNTNSTNRSTKVRKVKIAGVNVTLRGDQVDAFRALTTGPVQSSEIRQLLVLLPDAVAAKVQKAIGAVTTAAASPPAANQIAAKVKKVRKQVHPKHDATEPQPSQSPSQDGSQGSNDQSSSDGNGGSHGSGHSSKKPKDQGKGDNIPIPVPPVESGGN